MEVQLNLIMCLLEVINMKKLKIGFVFILVLFILYLVFKCILLIHQDRIDTSNKAYESFETDARYAQEETTVMETTSPIPEPVGVEESQTAETKSLQENLQSEDYYNSSYVTDEQITDLVHLTVNEYEEYQNDLSGIDWSDFDMNRENGELTVHVYSDITGAKYDFVYDKDLNFIKAIKTN